MEKKIYSITDISKYLKDLLANDPILHSLWITGEVSNFHHHNSGHMYFTLKDKNSSISSIMFRSHNRRLNFDVEDGMKVNVHGYVSIYEPRGTYQLYVDDLEPAGKGALYLEYEQLKARLEKEGLFAEEYKTSIPILPKKIGIVTSPTGAAIRDILSVVRRRFSNVYVLIVPSLVQGDAASSQIVNGIEYLNKRGDIDLIIVSRGGGSIEDLWAFNEENVARAIFKSSIPVISGVGHETDFTIADFTADLRAPTPSAAAELAISSRLELEKDLNNNHSRLINAIKNKLDNISNRVKIVTGKRIFSHPEELFAEKTQNLDDLSRQIEWNMEKKLNLFHEDFRLLNSKLESLSPLKTLSRGYSITSKKETIVDSINNIDIGDQIRTQIKDGQILSKVLETEEG